MMAPHLQKTFNLGSLQPVLQFVTDCHWRHCAPVFGATLAEAFSDQILRRLYCRSQGLRYCSTNENSTSLLRPCATKASDPQTIPWNNLKLLSTLQHGGTPHAQRPCIIDQTPACLPMNREFRCKPLGFKSRFLQWILNEQKYPFRKYSNTDVSKN